MLKLIRCSWGVFSEETRLQVRNIFEETKEYNRIGIRLPCQISPPPFPRDRYPRRQMNERTEVPGDKIRDGSRVEELPRNLHFVRQCE